MLNIIIWIIFGLIAGGIAKWIMPGKDPGGLVITILIGIAGAVIGGFIGRLLGVGGVTNSFSIGNFFLAIVGALLLLWGYRKMKAPEA